MQQNFFPFSFSCPVQNNCYLIGCKLPETIRLIYCSSVWKILSSPEAKGVPRFPKGLIARIRWLARTVFLSPVCRSQFAFMQSLCIYYVLLLLWRGLLCFLRPFELLSFRFIPLFWEDNLIGLTWLTCVPQPIQLQGDRHYHTVSASLWETGGEGLIGLSRGRCGGRQDMAKKKVIGICFMATTLEALFFQCLIMNYFKEHFFHT